jgi:ketosteroid isomerase-like protein
MSAENIEIVRRSIEATVRGDIEAAAADHHPDIEIDDHDLFDAGLYKGHAAYLRWLAQWNESFATWRIEDLKLAATPGDQVVATFVMVVTGSGSGIEMKRADALVCGLSDGKIVKMGYYNDQAQALTAAGLDGQVVPRQERSGSH